VHIESPEGQTTCAPRDKPLSSQTSCIASVSSGASDGWELPPYTIPVSQEHDSGTEAGRKSAAGRKPAKHPGANASTEELRNFERNRQRRVRYQEKHEETEVLQNWKEAVKANDFSLADELQHKILSTRTGQKAFPSLSQTAKIAGDAQLSVEDVANVKKLNQSMGPKSKHRAGMILRVAEGLPADFAAASLGVSPAYIRQARHRQQDSIPSLLTDARTETTAGRESKGDLLAGVWTSFFERHSDILSGASTYTRLLTLSKEQLEVILEAETPSLLREYVKRDPSRLPSDLPPSHVLTRLEMDILASVHAARAAGFTEAAEYETRLNTEQARYV